MKTFTVTDDHLKLLRSAYVRWEDCEYGAPAIDCKRPYGNSDVVGDIHELLGGSGEPTADQAETYGRLHAETLVALQIALGTGSFAQGIYRETSYCKWERV